MATKNTSPTAQSTPTAQDRIRSSAKNGIAGRAANANKQKGRLIAGDKTMPVSKRSAQKGLTSKSVLQTEQELASLANNQFEIRIVIKVPNPMDQIGKGGEKRFDEPLISVSNQPRKMSRWIRLGRWFSKFGSGVWRQVCKQGPAVIGGLIVGWFRK